MQRNIRSRALVLSTMIIAAASLLGCQTARMSAAEASGADNGRSEPAASAIEVAPADRKFFNQGYLYGWDRSRLALEREEIHPADIKFFEPGAELVEQIHPADIKFYNWAASEEIGLRELYESLHPADRKFLDLVGAR